MVSNIFYFHTPFWLTFFRWVETTDQIRFLKPIILGVQTPSENSFEALLIQPVVFGGSKGEEGKERKGKERKGRRIFTLCDLRCPPVQSIRPQKKAKMTQHHPRMIPEIKCISPEDHSRGMTQPFVDSKKKNSRRKIIGFSSFQWL